MFPIYWRSFRQKTEHEKGLLKSFFQQASSFSVYFLARGKVFERADYIRFGIVIHVDLDEIVLDTRIALRAFNQQLFNLEKLVTFQAPVLEDR